jgi:hypothetical protein
MFARYFNSSEILRARCRLRRISLLESLERSIARALESITMPRPNFYVSAIFDLSRHLLGRRVCDAVDEI